MNFIQLANNFQYYFINKKLATGNYYNYELI